MPIELIEQMGQVSVIYLSHCHIELLDKTTEVWFHAAERLSVYHILKTNLSVISQLLDVLTVALQLQLF